MKHPNFHMILEAGQEALDAFSFAYKNPETPIAVAVAVLCNNAEVIAFKGLTRATVEVVLRQNDQAIETLRLLGFVKA